MGYSGLSVGGSDTASDAAYDMLCAMIKSLNETLAEEGNEFNTGGVENVAFILDELIIPAGKAYFYLGNPDFSKLVTKVEVNLTKLLKATEKETWEDKESKRYHIKAYARLLKRLREYIAKKED
jgi:hypothetical protein